MLDLGSISRKDSESQNPGFCLISNIIVYIFCKIFDYKYIIMDNIFKIITYNCEGIRRTSDYLSQLVKLHSHDKVSLQETWCVI